MRKLRKFLMLTGHIADTGESGPASGSGLLLEDGSSFLLLETGDFLLLE